MAARTDLLCVSIIQIPDATNQNNITTLAMMSLPARVFLNQIKSSEFKTKRWKKEEEK